MRAVVKGGGEWGGGWGGGKDVFLVKLKGADTMEGEKEKIGGKKKIKGGRGGGKEEVLAYRPRPLASVTSANICFSMRKPATVMESSEKKPLTVPEP